MSKDRIKDIAFVLIVLIDWSVTLYYLHSACTTFIWTPFDVVLAMLKGMMACIFFGQSVWAFMYRIHTNEHVKGIKIVRKMLDSGNRSESTFELAKLYNMDITAYTQGEVKE